MKEPFWLKQMVLILSENNKAKGSDSDAHTVGKLIKFVEENLIHGKFNEYGE